MPRPGRFNPEKGKRYPLCRRLGGPEGRFGRLRKISPSPGFFFVFACTLHFISTCFFVSIVLYFAFLSFFYLKHTIQTSMSPAWFKPATPASDRQHTLILDCSTTGIGSFDPQTILFNSLTFPRFRLQILIKSGIRNCTKIRPVGADVLRAERHTWYNPACIRYWYILNADTQRNRYVNLFSRHFLKKK
jgi:hypothetical protein